MSYRKLFGFAVSVILLSTSVCAHAQDSCEKISALKIPDTSISLAQSEAAGTFNGPPAPFSGMDLSALYKSLPAFCRVVATASSRRLPLRGGTGGSAE